MNVHVFEPAGAMELRVVSHLSNGSDVERVIRKFINTVAGTRKNAMGVLMAWELALHDVLNVPGSVPGSVPLLAGMMNVMFPDVMEDLLADAPEFLSEVLSVRESILKDIFQ